jgi:hypothetical protein
MLIEVTTRTAYGTERIYPANDAARTLARLTRTTTLSIDQLYLATKLGHAVSRVSPVAGGSAELHAQIDHLAAKA